MLARAELICTHELLFVGNYWLHVDGLVRASSNDAPPPTRCAVVRELPEKPMM